MTERIRRALVLGALGLLAPSCANLKAVEDYRELELGVCARVSASPVDGGSGQMYWAYRCESGILIFDPIPGVST